MTGMSERRIGSEPCDRNGILANRDVGEAARDDRLQGGVGGSDSKRIAKSTRTAGVTYRACNRPEERNRAVVLRVLSHGVDHARVAHAGQARAH